MADLQQLENERKQLEARMKQLDNEKKAQLSREKEVLRQAKVHMEKKIASLDEEHSKITANLSKL
jgi:hypothetical protein